MTDASGGDFGSQVAPHGEVATGIFQPRPARGSLGSHNRRCAKVPDGLAEVVRFERVIAAQKLMGHVCFPRADIDQLWLLNV